MANTPPKNSQYPNTRGFFGRRVGRPIRKQRQDLIKAMLEELGLPKGDEKINTTALFPNNKNKELWMEIGYGDGEHLAALLGQYPDKNFIGIEPYINGTGNFLHRIKDDISAKSRIRVHMDDAIPQMDRLPDACLDRLYVLNPDPWPKTRHHKRRIINQQHLTHFARILKPNAWLVMATDVDDLAEWMAKECTNHPAFEWKANTPEDWQTKPDWWAITTRYAQKGMDAGRNETYLIFKKIN